MGFYNQQLKEWNNDREYNKKVNINHLKTIINTWVPNLEIKNKKNNNKTNFEKIVTLLENRSKISWRDDLAKKISNLRNNCNIKWEGIKYSFSEIATAISEYINENNSLTESMEIHKQIISRIIDRENNK
jgi:aldehyde:ferredoxin oxidoreductase